MAIVIDIADAVAAELSDGEFSQEFTAVRQYRPEFELPEMKDLHVTVVPKGVAITSLGRGVNQHDYQIDVAVQKKLATEDSAELDPLMALMEEIADFFRMRRLSSYPSAAWVKTENEPIYSQEHLGEMRQLTSVLTLTFRVVR
jgi:hypothetical protein